MFSPHTLLSFSSETCSRVSFESFKAKKNFFAKEESRYGNL